MAHFAKLDENNVVTKVVAVGNDEVSYNGDPAGETYCANLFGGTWKQTSYNTRGGKHYTHDSNGFSSLSEDQSKAFRNHFANKNFTYDPTNDIFIPLQPYSSWTLDSNYIWQAPITFPSVVVDSNNNQLEVLWNEDSQAWNANPYIDGSISDTLLVWNAGTSSWS